MDERQLQRYLNASLFIFFVAGILLVFKPAYDYTLIKNVVAFVFCLLVPLGFIFAKRSFSFSLAQLYAFLVFALWILHRSLFANCKYGAAASLENHLLYFLVFLTAGSLELKKEWLGYWLAAVFVASIIALGQDLWPPHYGISTFGNPNFLGGHMLMPVMLAWPLLKQVAESSGESRIFYPVLLFLVLAGALALCLDKYVLPVSPRLFLAGVVTLLVLPIILALVFPREGRDSGARRNFCIFLLLVLFLSCGTVVLFLTRSRAVIGGYLFGISLFLLLIFPKRGRDLLKGLTGFLSLLVLSAVLYPQFRNWFLTNIRFFIWRGTWKLISVRPVTGWGLGNFEFYYPYYRVREYFLQAEATPVTNHPHCQYLEILSEAGVVGLLLFLGLVVYILVAAYRQKPPLEPTGRKIRDETPDFGTTVLPGLICGVAAVLADNVFSTNLQNPSTAIYFWFLLGMLAGRCGPKREFSWNASRALWSATAVVAYAMIIFFSYYRILSQVHLKKAIWAKETRRYEQAIADYRLACRINYYDYVSWYKLAFVYGEINRLNEAGEVYQLINVFLFPHFAKTDMNLGTIYLKAGKPEQALCYYKWAEWFNPYDQDVLCSIASIYLVCYNNVPEAKKYLERVLKIDPKNEYANRALKTLEKK